MDNFIDKLAQKFIAGEVIRANQAAEEQELRRLRQQVAEYEACLQEMRKLQLRNTETAEDLRLLLEKSHTDMEESLRQLTQNSGMLVEESLRQLTQNGRLDMEESLRQLTQNSRVDMEEGLRQLMEKSYENMDSLVRESLDKISQLTAADDGNTVEEINRLLQVLEANQKEIGDWFKRADDFLHKENVKVYRNVQAVVVEENKTKTEAILTAQEETAKKYHKRTMLMQLLILLAAVAGVILQVLGIYGIF